MQIYTALLKIYIELKEDKWKPPNKIHLNIYQQNQPNPKDNFKPRGKTPKYVNQHFTAACNQNPHKKGYTQK